MAAIAYLGTFTRYMADDYCETYNTQTYSPLGAVINRYQDGVWRAANRYSNLLFVGVVESLLGRQSIEIIPVIMIIFWTIGLFYLVRQVRKLAGIQWHVLLDIFLGTDTGFPFHFAGAQSFSNLLLASSMATHFVPLVFLNFLVVFLLYRMRKKKRPALCMDHPHVAFCNIHDRRFFRAPADCDGRRLRSGVLLISGFS